MIISRTPIRVSLGAGGTDLPVYYRRFGAEYATAAGSKYVYVMVNSHPEKVVWMGMYHAERVNSPSGLRHRVVREVLDWMGLRKNIQIVSVSEVPTNSGLGSSASFIVGLLNALHAYKGEFLWPHEIAEEACRVEQDLLQEAVGNQDQYAAALGGVLWLKTTKTGKVSTSRLTMRPAFLQELNSHLAFFYTGIQRNSYSMQTWAQDTKPASGAVLEALHMIRKVAHAIKKSLQEEDVNEFGRQMHLHWMYKTKLSDKVSSKRLNALYELALSSGAIGGNLMGAGGGGHFMFVCPDAQSRRALASRLALEGLREVDIRFEMQGTSIVSLSQ